MCRIKVASVALDGAAGSYDKLYTYRIPDALYATAIPGCRVFVPFGRGNSKRIGMIFSVSDETDPGTYKDILSAYKLLDNTDDYKDEFFNLVRMVAKRS